MARLKWSENVVRPYTLGVDRGILHIPGSISIPWNGIQEVSESSPDSVMSELFQDGQRMSVHKRDLNFEAKLKVFTYPPEFEPYAGYNPSLLKPFNFSYRVMTGETSYRLHLIYNIVAIPDDVVFSSLGESIDPTYFSWTLTTRPVKLSGRFPSSHLIIDSETVYPWTLEAIENQLYGAEEVIPHIPSPDEIIAIFEANSIFKVVDNGDGTATISGPDDTVKMLDATTYKLEWPSVIQVDSETYSLSSL